MSRDVLGDFLTSIRNGIMASRSSVVTPYSRMRFEIARILKREGFIKDVVHNVEGRSLTVLLKYVNGESVIHKIQRVSSPGRRVYAGAHSLSPVVGGLGISIVTTSAGLKTDKEIKGALGGEVVCTVW